MNPVVYHNHIVSFIHVANSQSNNSKSTCSPITDEPSSPRASKKRGKRLGLPSSPRPHRIRDLGMSRDASMTSKHTRLFASES
jgi:hypothetical protein